jgi:hypothetical protein
MTAADLLDGGAATASQAGGAVDDQDIRAGRRLLT